MHGLREQHLPFFGSLKGTEAPLPLKNKIKINLILHFNKKLSSLCEMLIWSELPIPSSFREVLLSMSRVPVLNVPESAWPSVL